VIRSNKRLQKYLKILGKKTESNTKIEKKESLMKARQHSNKRKREAE